MASVWGRKITNDKKSEEQKNAERIQDFINKFKIRSKDLDNTSARKAEKETMYGSSGVWEGHQWFQEAVETVDDRSIQKREYREMCKTPEINQSLNIYCLHPNTIINTLHGDFTIKELSEKYENSSFDVWSYNCKENRIDIGRAKNPHKTLENADVYKIVFDDGSEIISTANHPFLLKSGIYQKLENLKIGDHVQSLRRVKKGDRYSISTLRYGSMMDYQYVWFLKHNEKVKRPYVIHHIDENKSNNRIENLKKMTQSEHIQLHSFDRWNNKEFRTKIKNINDHKNIIDENIRREKISKSWTEERKQKFGLYISSLLKSDPVYKERITLKGPFNGMYNHSITKEFIFEESKKFSFLNDLCETLNIGKAVVCSRISELGFNSWTELKQYHCSNLIIENKNKKMSNVVKISPYSRTYFYDVLTKMGYSSWNNLQQEYNNHTVVSIEYYGKSDVYDLEVEEFHNFSANGVFVHNSDNATQYNSQHNVLEIQSNNSKVVEILNKLFFETLDMNGNLWHYVRNTCKLGDEFLEVVVDNEKNPKNIISLERFKKCESMERIEEDGNLVKFIYTTGSNQENNKTSKEFQPWQVIHLKIEDEETEPYGQSVLEAGRKIWKKLSLMEDAMIVYRISRAPERRVFYIDVGNLSTKDANNHLEAIKSKFRKKNFINSHGEVDQKANALATDEDFFIAVRQNSNGTRIETLPGGCLTLDTKIPSLDGKEYTLQEMISKYENDEEQWIYSCDPKTGNIVPGIVSWAGITHRSAKIMELTLDNGEKIRCTPDHKFPIWGKGETEAKDIQINDSIISHNTKLSSKEDGDKINGYEKIYNHSNKKWIYTHKIVANELKNSDKYNQKIYKLEEKLTTIHHIDGNRRNNLPSNLYWMGNKDHYMYHYENVDCLLDGYKNWYNSFSKKQKDEFHKKQALTRTKNYTEILSKDIEYMKNLSINHSIGANNYCKNIDDDEYKIRCEINKNNNINGVSKKRNDIFNRKMNEDSKFRSKVLLKRRFSISRAFTEERKKSFSKFSKDLWNNSDHYNKVFKNTLIKFDEVLFTKFIDIYKQQKNYTKTLEWINENPENEFTKHLKELNRENTGNFNPEKLTSRFTNRFLKFCGYENIKDFSLKMGLRNHRVISIKYLDYKEDVGTLTIDKEEKYHSHHTFALSAGIYTFNSNTGEIGDVQYFKNQLLSTLGIPPAFLGIVDQQASASYDPKSYLSNQEMQFSRTIERIQKLIIKGLEKIAILELVFNDIDEDELKNFKIVLTPPSSVEQLMDIEVLTAKFGLIQSVRGMENLLPDDWIYKNILNMSDEEIVKIKLQIQMQLQQQTQLQAALQSMAAGENERGGPEMMGGGDLGGGGGGIMDQPIGGPSPEDAGGGEMPAPEAGAPEGPSMDVAHNYIEFDGTKWLLESKKDLNNLIKYINLYEKANKDKYTDTHAHNRATRMTIKGEFRGLLQACKTKKNSLND